MNVGSVIRRNSDVSAFGDVHFAQLLIGSFACAEKHRDGNLSQFALESRMISRPLEVKARTTIVPALLQDATAQLTDAVKLRVKATCTSGVVKRSAYFSRSLPSQLHPTSPGVSPEDHPKRNIDVLDKPDDSLPSTTPDTQNSEGIDIESHIRCFDDVTDCLGVDKVHKKNLILIVSSLMMYCS